MRTKLTVLFLAGVLSCTICNGANELKSENITYLAQDSKKLADLPSNSELWTGTAICEPRAKSMPNIPPTITLVYLVDAPAKKTRHGSVVFPEGTEIKIHLNFKPDGKYQSVYIMDLRRAFSAAGY